MASATKMFFAGMGVMLIVLKPEVGVALVNTAAQGLGTVASAMSSAIDNKQAKQPDPVVTEQQPASAIIDHISIPKEAIQDSEMTPQEFDEVFEKKAKVYKGTSYTIRG